MKSYGKITYAKTTIKRNISVEGETIETKMERVLSNKEKITDGAPLIYTERKDGVQSGYNVRTDRFEVAIDALDYVSKSAIAKRMNTTKETEVIQLKPDGGAEPTGGTNENQ